MTLDQCPLIAVSFDQGELQTVLPDGMYRFNMEGWIEQLRAIHMSSEFVVGELSISCAGSEFIVVDVDENIRPKQSKNTWM